MNTVCYVLGRDLCPLLDIESVLYRVYTHSYYVLGRDLYTLINVENVLDRVNTASYVLGRVLYTLIDVENILYRINVKKKGYGVNTKETTTNSCL